MSTYDQYEAAAVTVEGLVTRPGKQYCLEYTAGFLRERADQAKRENEVDGLAQRLRTVWATTYDASRTPREWGQECEYVRNAWRAVAREAMAAHAEDAEARLRRNPETVASIHQSLSTTVGDCEVLADGSLGDPEDWAARTPSTIPADATGLKGKRARVVGPILLANGNRGSSSLNPGDVVTIWHDEPDGDGDLQVARVDGPDAGLGRFLAASSLALIPDEPTVGTHGPCGAEHRAYACTEPSGHEGEHVAGGSGGQKYARWVEPQPTVPEPPVGTRLRDRDGQVWERMDWPSRSHWHGPQQNYTWREMREELGPLHQVYAAWDDVPPHVAVKASNSYTELFGCGLANKDFCACPEIERDYRAPFVAVNPYGTTEADQ